MKAEIMSHMDSRNFQGSENPHLFFEGGTMKAKIFLAVICCSVFMVMPAWDTMREARAEGVLEVCDFDETTVREAVPPAISFIEQQRTTCYKPDLRRDVCYITFGDIMVDAAPASYMLFLTITINGIVVAHNHGFFANELHIPSNAHGPGFMVKCGKPFDHDSDPATPDMGNRYDFVIRARDSNNQFATNLGSVFCPPHVKGKR